MAIQSLLGQKAPPLAESFIERLFCLTRGSGCSKLFWNLLKPFLHSTRSDYLRCQRMSSELDVCHRTLFVLCPE
jgi:hypothetical protein